MPIQTCLKHSNPSIYWNVTNPSTVHVHLWPFSCITHVNDKEGAYISCIAIGKLERQVCKASSVEQIGDFWNRNPVQNFLSVIRSDPNPVDLSKYLIQSGLYLKKKLWLSNLLQWSMQFGYPCLIRLSFFQNPVQPDPVLRGRIRLDRDPETGSCLTQKASHCDRKQQ